MTAQRNSRGWVAGGLVVLAVAGSGLVFAAANGWGFDSTDPGDTLGAPTTAPVTRGTLVATTQRSGTVQNAHPLKIKAASGTVTWLPSSGAMVNRGGTLARVDDKPIVLLFGSLPMYRSLAVGAKGADVRQFEANLVALGFTGFTVDTEFTAKTARAVKKWQKSLGLDQTGSVGPDLVRVASGPSTVIAVTATVGDSATGDLISVATRERVLDVELDPSEQQFAVMGAVVSYRLGTDKPATGKIIAVESVVAESRDGGEGQNKLKVQIRPSDAASIPATGTARAVVSFTAQARKNVLSVPVVALLALAGGGYGVEVAEVVDGQGTGSQPGGPAGQPEATPSTSATSAPTSAPTPRVRTRLVAVTTGLFADGRVEVTGAGIGEGVQVVVPE